MKYIEAQKQQTQASCYASRIYPKSFTCIDVYVLRKIVPDKKLELQWARDHKRHSSHEKQDDTGDLLLSGTVHVLLATGTYKQLDYSILVDKNLSKDPIFAIYMYNVYTKSLKNKIPPS